MDEEIEDEESLEEATQMQNKVADMGAKEPLGNPGADSKDSPLSSIPNKTFVANSKEGVENKEGGDGNMSDNANPNSPKDHTPADNINVDHKAVNHSDEMK